MEGVEGDWGGGCRVGRRRGSRKWRSMVLSSAVIFFQSVNVGLFVIL